MKKIMLVTIFICIVFTSFSIEEAGKNETNKKLIEDVKLSKIIHSLTIAHMIFGGISYTSLLVEDGFGFSLLYNAYNNPDYDVDPLMHGLKISHMILMIAGFSSFFINDILSFIMFGLKVYHKKPVNIAHFTASIITTVFFLIECVSMSLTGYAFNNNTSWKKEMAVRTLHNSFLVGIFSLFLNDFSNYCSFYIKNMQRNYVYHPKLNNLFKLYALQIIAHCVFTLFKPITVNLSNRKLFFICPNNLSTTGILLE